MVRSRLSRWLLAFACLVPAPLAAQTSPAGPSPAYDVLLDDVGTWDAEILIWDAGRRPRASRGVEINTLGCGGTCLQTTVQGNLPAIRGFGGAPPPRRSGTASSRELITPVPGVGSGPPPSGDWSPEFVSAPGDALGRRAEVRPRSMSPDARLQALTGPVPAARTSFAYPKAGVRIVTLFAPDPKGREVQVARITYTRRR